MTRTTLQSSIIVLSIIVGIFPFPDPTGKEGI
jgi:hypothetical protein